MIPQAGKLLAEMEWHFVLVGVTGHFEEFSLSLQKVTFKLHVNQIRINIYLWYLNVSNQCWERYFK